MLTNSSESTVIAVVHISNYTNNKSIFYSKCLELDNDTEILLKFVIYGVLLNVVGVFGIFGNIISMVILSRPQMRSSINYLLLGLARVDTVLIITSMLIFGLPALYPYSDLMFTYHFVVYPHLALVVYPLATMIHTASIYLTLTVSLERYVAVCFPLRARSLCTYGRARFYVVGIVIFSILYNLPRLWEGQLLSEWIEEYNQTVYCPTKSDLRDNLQYREIYVHWLYLVCMYLLPFNGLMFLNASIYRQVLKANRERQRLSRLQRREIGLATMLLCVVVVFFVCNLLPLVINIIETFQIDMDLPVMIYASNLLVTINSSVNFIIYVIFGEKFQRLFLVLFCSNSSLFGGRESPDGANEDSYTSNGDRSIRLQRQSTSISRNGVPYHHNSSIRVNGSIRESRHNSSRQRTASPSPGPCVYYPASRSKNNKELSTYTTQTSIPNDE